MQLSRSCLSSLLVAALLRSNVRFVDQAIRRANE